ncbi:MAG: 30S ribosomal protein S13 [bacterium]|nr:30S ribosomal protein S13 [bacterium]
MRISGIDLPDQKLIWVSLTRLYGVGPNNVKVVLAKAKVEITKRSKDLTAEEIARISKVLEEYKIEGDLRREVSENIKRLKEIGSYRGSRHTKGLPSRGQRTRTNARTKRGKRMTIGALKKEAMAKQTTKTVEEKK